MHSRIWQLMSILTLLFCPITSVIAKENKIIGFLQGQFINDQSEEVINNEFTIHRARIGISGKITEQIDYNLILGAVEPPNKDAHLVNAFVNFKYTTWLKIRVGQFLVPFGLEGHQSIIFNPAIERGTATRKLNPLRMFRDRGLQVSGKYARVNYAVAITNGTGANAAEDNNTKDILGRVGFSPLSDLNLGISAHCGNYVSGSRDDLNRKRSGVDIEYIYGPFRLRGEAMDRHDEQIDDSKKISTGWYILSAYKFISQAEGILRYEQYDPDTSIPNDKLDITTLGLNYYFLEHTRLSVNYEFKNDKTNSKIGNRLTAQLQIIL